MTAAQQLEHACQVGRWEAGHRATHPDAAPWPVGLPPLDAGASGAESLRLVDVERAHILKIFNRCDHNVTNAARMLGLTRGGLYSKLRVYRVLPTKPIPLPILTAVKQAVASLLAVALVGCGTVKGTVESRELSVESQTARALPPIPSTLTPQLSTLRLAAPVIVAPPKPPPVLTLMWDKNDSRPEVETQIYATSDLRDWTFYGATNGESYPVPATEQQQFFRVRNKLGEQYSEWNN